MNVTVNGSNPISIQERQKQLQFMADNLTDDELDKLYILSKSPKARKKLQTSWGLIRKMVL
jgi:hypothetical protein